jgi:hypothetical protein
VRKVLCCPKKHKKSYESISTDEHLHELRRAKGYGGHRKRNHPSEIVHTQGEPEMGSPVEESVYGVIKSAFLFRHIELRCRINLYCLWGRGWGIGRWIVGVNPLHIGLIPDVYLLRILGFLIGLNVCLLLFHKRLVMADGII